MPNVPQGPLNWRAHPSDQPAAYVPAGPKEPLLFEQFNGINTSTTRPGVADDKAWWMDGFMPLGPRFLRTLYGVGDPLVPGITVAFFAFVNIGATPYCITVGTNGAVVATNTETFVNSTIAIAGTITNPSRLNVGISQYGSLYVLIVANQTNGYFIWDGTTFHVPGGAAPVSGTMPLAISGTAIETYAGRIWIVNADDLTFSAPGSLIDFSSGGGGGTVSSTDSFLRSRYIQLLQTNGFLYLIADSSINYISGVQTSGTPPVTTYTNQNADPEVGTPWPSTVGTFGRNILFANAFGAHASYGASVNKISEELDGVYNTVANFGDLIPSTAKAIIFGKKVWILLLPIIDPVSGEQVNKLFMWNGQRWWSSPQDVELVYIQSQEIDSVITAWGTDGTSIYPLFQEPSTAFTKTVQSKLWDKPLGYTHDKAATRLWGLLQYYSISAPELRITIDNESNTGSANLVTAGISELMWTNNADTEIAWLNNSLATIEWFGSGTGISVIAPTAVGQHGALLGITGQTEAADMAIISLAIDVQQVGYRG